MNNNNALTARRRWTPQQRARQAQRIRAYRPWLKSTGPKTPAGKQISSRNASKAGLNPPEIKAIQSYLEAGRVLLKALNRKLKERERAAREAGRRAGAGPQKVLHIVADAALPISRSRRPASIAGSAPIAGDAATCAA